MATESGATLIEVLVSAVVLFVATGAIVGLLNASARTSVVNRDRTTSSSLAEKDQERLRGLSLATLNAMTITPAADRTTTLGGVRYTVSSDAEWVNDAAGFTPTCTSGTDGTADYLKITSTVTPATTVAGVQGQTISSLLSPKVSTVGSKGTLSVPFVDHDDNPLPGVLTSVSGASSGSATSNSAGCAVFNYYLAGSYTASYSRSGYVTPDGSTATQTLPATINTNQTTITDVQKLDRAARVTATYQTRPTSAAATQATTEYGFTLANSDMSFATGTRTFSGSTQVASLTGTNLFPFANGYAAYAGTCSANDPTKYGVAATKVTPDPAASVGVVLYEPSLILSGGGNPFTRVVVTATDSGCSQKYTYSFSSRTSYTLSVPFGTYTVCGDNGQYRVSQPGVVMSSVDPKNLTLNANNAVGGTCS